MDPEVRTTSGGLFLAFGLGTLFMASPHVWLLASIAWGGAARALFLCSSTAVLTSEMTVALSSRRCAAACFWRPSLFRDARWCARLDWPKRRSGVGKTGNESFTGTGESDLILYKQQKRCSSPAMQNGLSEAKWQQWQQTRRCKSFPVPCIKHV